MKLATEIEASVAGIGGRYLKINDLPVSVPSCNHTFFKDEKKKNGIMVVHGNENGSVTCNKIEGAKL